MGIPFHTMQGTVDLMALTSGDVVATVIADGLSKINRFNGRTPGTWSVAAHSVIVSRLCPPDLEAWGLLHDAHEVFLGDITSPAVHLLKAPMTPGAAETIDYAIRRAKIELDEQIAVFWGVESASLEEGLLLADWAALEAEMHVFFGVPIRTTYPENTDLAERAVQMIRELPAVTTWHDDRQTWLETAKSLEARGLLRLPS
ncbi:MAG: hypothetical protein ACKVKF_04330 [Rhodobacterales bacterium]|nr:hypothetical protein [Puniceibacterium antarcticum]